MKKLTCEMCGSNDLMKQDGAFVCQNCGMKYSVEEAKKMMIEGTVEVQGTVQVDNTPAVQNYLANARRAMQKEDWEEVEKYYNLVEQNAPTNIEAIFYSAYGKAKASLSVNEIHKREAIFKALRNSVNILDDNYDVDNSSECNAIMERIVDDVIQMFGSSFVYTETTNGYGIKSDNKVATYQLFIGVGAELNKTLDNIAQKLSRDRKADCLFVRKLQLKLVDFLTTPGSHLSNDSMITNCNIAKNILAEAKKLDPSFAWPRNYNDRIESINKEKRNGCWFKVLITLAIIVGGIIGIVIGLD